MWSSMVLIMPCLFLVVYLVITADPHTPIIDYISNKILRVTESKGMLLLAEISWTLTGIVAYIKITST